MATVEQNDTGISSSSVVKTEMAAGTDKRFKFLCSYGGKILPQPSDGQLKYVGGETRVICVPRSISFLGIFYLLISGHRLYLYGMMLCNSPNLSFNSYIYYMLALIFTVWLVPLYQLPPATFNLHGQ